MRVWTVKEAQENFDELLDAAELEPQEVIDGDRSFLVFSAQEWQSLKQPE